MREGSKLITIKHFKIETCEGCKYHSVKVINPEIPIEGNNCNHPEIHKNRFQFPHGNIGEDNITPDWCPVNKSIKTID